MQRVTTEGALELSAELPGAPSLVFAAWTRPEILSAWLAPGSMITTLAEVDVRRGGNYCLHFQEVGGETHVASGHYEDVVPDERLVLRWTWQGPVPHPHTRVTVALRAGAQGTALRLRHEGLSSRESVEQHLLGWTDCVEKLRRWCTARGRWYPAP